MGCAASSKVGAAHGVGQDPRPLDAATARPSMLHRPARRGGRASRVAARRGSGENTTSDPKLWGELARLQGEQDALGSRREYAAAARLQPRIEELRDAAQALGWRGSDDPSLPPPPLVREGATAHDGGGGAAAASAEAASVSSQFVRHLERRLCGERAQAAGRGGGELMDVHAAAGQWVQRPGSSAHSAARWESGERERPGSCHSGRSSQAASRPTSPGEEGGEYARYGGAASKKQPPPGLRSLGCCSPRSELEMRRMLVEKRMAAAAHRERGGKEEEAVAAGNAGGRLQPYEWECTRGRDARHPSCRVLDMMQRYSHVHYPGAVQLQASS